MLQRARRLSKNLAEDVRDRAAGGVCAGGKKPTARSINRILKLFESFKIRTAGRKYFFDTLRARCILQRARFIHVDARSRTAGEVQ